MGIIKGFIFSVAMILFGIFGLYLSKSIVNISKKRAEVAKWGSIVVIVCGVLRLIIDLLQARGY